MYIIADMCVFVARQTDIHGIHGYISSVPPSFLPSFLFQFLPGVTRKVVAKLWRAIVCFGASSIAVLKTAEWK